MAKPKSEHELEEQSIPDKRYGINSLDNLQFLNIFKQFL